MGSQAGKSVLKQMEELEKILLEKGITRESLERMQKLEHELLELENASLKRNQDNKRKSETNVLEQDFREIQELKLKRQMGGITGSGGDPSVTVVPDTTDWLALTESYIFAADTTLPTGTYSTGTVLGTQSHPIITYCSGNVSLSGTAYGYGIMIINGAVSMSGNFTYHGIVIVYGQSSITCS